MSSTLSEKINPWTHNKLDDTFTTIITVLQVSTVCLRNTHLTYFQSEVTQAGVEAAGASIARDIIAGITLVSH
jgi:hypothetical protein